MNTKELQNLLRKIVPSAKLPSHIDFEVTEDCLFLNMDGNGVIANMQDDDSAFEGWAIVIKAALPMIKTVILDWDDPTCDSMKERNHYNRFLMRIANFRRGYDWFDVIDGRKAMVDAMQSLLDSKTIVVNFPKGPCSLVVNAEKKPEAYLERELVRLWSSPDSITDEQLPVGLFTNIVSNETGLTPGRGSQIDLWQLSDNTMRIYELKVDGNEKIGIISELMFYVCAIRNIVDGLIKYPDLTKVKTYRHSEDFANVVKNKAIQKVIGYLTASKFHPLIESHRLKDTILGILNDNTLNVEFEYKDISNIKLP